MKFEVRGIQDAPAPAQKNDRYATVVTAFKTLPQGQALFLQPEGKEKVRGMQVALRRRLGDVAELRAAEDGLWCWRKGDEPSAGPLAPRGNNRQLAANGATPR